MSEIYAFTASPGHNGLIDVFAIGDPGDDDSGTTVFLSRAAPGERWPPWASAGLPDLGAIGLQSIAGPDRYGHILARAGGREAAKRQAARPGPGSGPSTSPVCRPPPCGRACHGSRSAAAAPGQPAAISK